MCTISFCYAFTVDAHWLDHASVYELIEVTLSKLKWANFSFALYIKPSAIHLHISPSLLIL
uniref:Uncharacterized protein n=1 Tax=Triticum urartu TaxID=4572 RepID=A0A8R7PYK3_TRIUA